MVVTGAVQGPNLPVATRPWPIGWEQNPMIDACSHLWEHVLVQTYDGRNNEVVVRCRDCHAPRCGHSTDRDPCMLRRHHRLPREHLPHSQWSRVPDLTDRAAVDEWLEGA